MRGAATTTIYWIVVFTLFGVSAFFAYRVEQFRSKLRKSTSTKCLKDGDSVIVQRAIDGDEVLVKGDKCVAIVRILGIKAFSLKSEPALLPVAKRALSILEGHQGKRVVIFDLQKKLDSRRRHLAKLRDGEVDLGQRLVERGWALVYVRYPFPGMLGYQKVQAKARADRKGLWGVPQAAVRATGLQRKWELERKR